MDLFELTIQKFHAAIRNHSLSVAELVSFYLERIARFDHQINSIILVNPQALEQAKALDDAFARNGELTGPLHGVPVLLKDNIETVDMPTSAGSLLLKDFYSKRDAFIVKKLKNAGAIIIAKTNLHEFAIWGETVSSIKGQTLNPYDLSRTPGGSSGGTGAALAANFGLVGIGTDSVNSIRSPSSANNLVGLRPTIGSVSRSGIVPYSLTQDTAGAMARCAEDVALVQSVIAGYDPLDPVTAWGKRFGRGPGSLEKAPVLKGKRLGVLRSFFGTGEEAEPVNLVMTETLKELAVTGAELIDLDETITSPEVQERASVHLFELKRDLNAYLTDTGAPVDSLQAILGSKQYHPSLEQNLIEAQSLSTDNPIYNQKLTEQGKLREWLVNLLAENDLDGILYPHQQILVCKVGGSQRLRNGVLASVTGFPSICLPVGFSRPDENARIGLPVGMEIIAEPFSENRLIDLARAFEIFPKHKPPLFED